MVTENITKEADTPTTITEFLKEYGGPLDNLLALQSGNPPPIEQIYLDPQKKKLKYHLGKIADFHSALIKLADPECTIPLTPGEQSACSLEIRFHLNKASDALSTVDQDLALGQMAGQAESPLHQTIAAAMQNAELLLKAERQAQSLLSQVSGFAMAYREKYPPRSTYKGNSSAANPPAPSAQPAVPAESAAIAGFLEESRAPLDNLLALLGGQPSPVMELRGLGISDDKLREALDTALNFRTGLEKISTPGSTVPLTPKEKHACEYYQGSLYPLAPALRTIYAELVKQGRRVSPALRNRFTDAIGDIKTLMALDARVIGDHSLGNVVQLTRDYDKRYPEGSAVAENPAPAQPSVSPIHPATPPIGFALAEEEPLPVKPAPVFGLADTPSGGRTGFKNAPLRNRVDRFPERSDSPSVTFTQPGEAGAAGPLILPDRLRDKSNASEASSKKDEAAPKAPENAAATSTRKKSGPKASSLLGLGLALLTGGVLEYAATHGGNPSTTVPVPPTPTPSPTPADDNASVRVYQYLGYGNPEAFPNEKNPACDTTFFQPGKTTDVIIGSDHPVGHFVVDVPKGSSANIYMGKDTAENCAMTATGMDNAADGRPVVSINFKNKNGDSSHDFTAVITGAISKIGVLEANGHVFASSGVSGKLQGTLDMLSTKAPNSLSPPLDILKDTQMDELSAGLARNEQTWSDKLKVQAAGGQSAYTQR